MKWLKSIVVFLICPLIVFISLFPCFAIEGSFSDSNFLTKQTLVDNFFSSGFDFSAFDSHPEFVSAMRSRVAEYPDEVQILSYDIYSGDTRLFCFRDMSVMEESEGYEIYFSSPSGSIDYDVFTINRFSSYDDSLSRYHTYPSISFSVDSIFYFACNDYDQCVRYSNYYASYSNHIFYYSGNILALILDYLDNGIQSFYDVDDVSGTYIKYFSAFDSFKGNYNEKYYGDSDIRNYLNSSVVFDDTIVDVHYASDVDVDTSDYYQHKENLIFYVDFKDETIKNNLTALSDSSYVIGLMNSCTAVKHYTQNVISFQSWFSNLNLDYYINSKHQFVFVLSNSYTYMNTLFQGTKVVTSASLLNEDDGAVSGGFGRLSDDSIADNKQALRERGWSNGYPNTADYPYHVDIYKDAEPYLQIYFKSKPRVISYFYTDSQIKYTVDMTSATGYFYSVPFNLSSSFDFAEIEKIDKSLLVAIIEKLDTDRNISLVDLQDYINSTYGSQDFISSSLSVVYNVAKSYLNMNNDIDNVVNKKLVIWTNYTGDINRTNWVGYHCRFNWDVDVDGSFIRGNSDDTHNYHNDVVKDIISDTEIATELTTVIDGNGDIISSYNTTYNYYSYYTYDNNGNVHGGGDNTYVATEPPTHLSEISFSGNSYDFGTDLVSSSSNFLNFLKSALSFFPVWIWSLVGLGLTVVIFLRILGR